MSSDVLDTDPGLAYEREHLLKVDPSLEALELEEAAALLEIALCSVRDLWDNFTAVAEAMHLDGDADELVRQLTEAGMFGQERLPWPVLWTEVEETWRRQAVRMRN